MVLFFWLYLLKIKTKKGSLSEIFESAKNEIDYITDRLSEFERNFFTKDEFKMLPAGDKIVKILEKLKIY